VPRTDRPKFAASRKVDLGSGKVHLTGVIAAGRGHNENGTSTVAHYAGGHALPVRLVEQLLGGSEYDQLSIPFFCGTDDGGRWILSLQKNGFCLDAAAAQGGQHRFGDPCPTFADVAGNDPVFFCGPLRRCIREWVPLLRSDLIEKGARDLDDGHHEDGAIRSYEVRHELGYRLGSKHTSGGDEDAHDREVIGDTMVTLHAPSKGIPKWT